MIDNQGILFSEVWDGVEHCANAKVREGQSTKWLVKTTILLLQNLYFSLIHSEQYNSSSKH